MDYSKNINDITSFKELLEILDSEVGDIAKKLDSDDGSYDGTVDLKIYNEWRISKGFEPIETLDGSTTMPLIEVVKGIYEIMRETKSLNHSEYSGNAIKVDFDPVSELYKQ